MFLSFFANILSYVFCLFGFISSQNLFPEPLSKSKEEYYLRRYFSGDKSARDVLIEHNLRLVAHIAKKYTSKEQELDDLISIGSIGLIKAIDSFSQDKGYKISTYASKCVENEILMYMRSSKKQTQEVSMNSIIGTDKDGNDMELMDVLDAEEKDAIETIYTKVITEQMIDYINTKLPEREKNIMNERYGLNGYKPKTQQEVAEKLGISRSYVSRIETKMQKKLSKILFKE